MKYNPYPSPLPPPLRMSIHETLYDIVSPRNCTRKSFLSLFVIMEMRVMIDVK